MKRQAPMLAYFVSEGEKLAPPPYDTVLLLRKHRTG